MPTRFLSDAEIERLEGWPESIERRDVVRFFAPAGEDLAFVREQRGAANQLAVALQLGALRWLGFVPEELAAVPPDTLAMLADTLDVSPRAIFDYAVRAQTRGEHRLLVRAYAGFRPFSEREFGLIGDRFVDAALEHERPSLLLVRVWEILRGDRVERPSIDRMIRLVAWARERAHERTAERLAPQLTDPIRGKLDGLLVTEAGRCGHSWLRTRPTSVSARALGRELEKRAFLIDELGADRFDLAGLPPNRRAWLAQTGRQQTNQALSRMAPERRYPVLMAFCVQALERTTDDAIEIYDRALGAADRAAQRKREELERRARRDTQATVRKFIDLSSVILEAHESGGDVLRLVERRIGIERLRADRDRAQGIVRPSDTGHLDLLIADSGSIGRKLLAAVNESLQLRPVGVDEAELLAALRLIRQLASDKRRWLPGFSPSAFIDNQWRPQVVDASRGRLDRRAYELCAAYELRSALRAGRVGLPVVMGQKRTLSGAPRDHLAHHRCGQKPVAGAPRTRTPLVTCSPALHSPQDSGPLHRKGRDPEPMASLRRGLLRHEYHAPVRSALRGIRGVDHVLPASCATTTHSSCSNAATASGSPSKKRSQKPATCRLGPRRSRRAAYDRRAADRG